LVRSDHAALTFLRHAKEPVGQQARWLDFVEQFDITVQHRSGSANRAADALSRRPCEVTGPCKQCSRGTGPLVARLTTGCENWEATVCPQSTCAVVVTRKQARGRARREEEADPPSDGGRVSDPPLRGGGAEDPPFTGGGAKDPPCHEGPRQQTPPSLKFETRNMPIVPPPVEFRDQPRETADYMSGRVLDTPILFGGARDPPSEELSESRVAPLISSNPVEVGWTEEEIKRLQREDANIGPVMAWLETGLRPPREVLDISDTEIKSYWMQWDSLTLTDGLVYRKFNDQMEPVNTCNC